MQRIGYRNDKTGHRCSNKCPRCFAVPSCKQSDAKIVKCNECKRAFFGTECFERHRSAKSYDGKSLVNICSAIRFCEDCGRVLKSGTRHECGVSFCKLCRSPMANNHLCHMQPLRRVNANSINEPSTSAAVAAPITEEGEFSVDEGTNKRTNSRGKGRVAFVFYFETR